MSDIIIEWGQNHLTAMVTSGGEHPQIIQAESLLGSNHNDDAFSINEAGEAIQEWLNSCKIQRGKTTVVLPREAVVVRQLQLPNAPDDELPDLVRFQAATKTSTPIDELALDFLPQETTTLDGQRQIMVFTIERRKLGRIVAVLNAAELTVSKVTASPLSTAQLVRQAVPHPVGTTKPAMIVFQQGSRVEISILNDGNLIQTQSTNLPEFGDEDRLKPLKRQISRSIVNLHQSHPELDIDTCYYVGTDDQEVAGFLEQRFEGRFEHVDVSRVVGGDIPAGQEPLVLAALPPDDKLLAIDFLNPRKKIEKPDRRKWYWIGGGVAAALLLLVGYGMFASQKASLQANIDALTTRSVDLDGQLKKGEPSFIAHQRLSGWKEGQTELFEIWTQLQNVMPTTDKLYISELRVSPKQGEVQAHVTGIGYSRQRSFVEDFKDALANNGFRVKPQATKDSNRDPDFPIQFELDVELLREQPQNDPKLAASTK